MTLYRLIFLAWSLLLLAGEPQTGAPVVTVNGPYSGNFIPAGLGLKKPLLPEGSPVEGDHEWTMYGWFKSEGTTAAIMNERTVGVA